MVEPFEEKPELDNERDAGLLRFVADLFASRTPDNCDGKDCRFRSGWCFHASHDLVYSEESTSSSDVALNPEKQNRASD